MKKFLGLLTVLMLAITLVACNKDKDGNGDGGNGDGGNGDGGGGSRPTEIVIMHGAVHEVDPRHENYSGNEKAARIKLHEDTEKELNVKIVYKQYPPDAPWGPGRQEAIINWYVGDSVKADIYWIPTIWLGDIVNANAIVPIQEYLKTNGKNIDPQVLDLTEYHGKSYGFMAEKLVGESGLFYNTSLITELNLEDPVDLWNKGEWTWSKFENYITSASSKLGAEQSVLGSMPSLWAEGLIPLNQGSIVSFAGKSVDFSKSQALEVYTMLEKWYKAGNFEKDPGYEGSTAWSNGDVLFHPGNLWFVRSSERWGGYEFVKDGNIGVVPFPMPDTAKKSEYRMGVGEAAIYTIANTKNEAKQELAFQVWDKVQLWGSEEDYAQSFEDSLKKTFDEQKFVDVYMEIYNKTYLEIHGILGLNAYNPNAWQIRVNAGVKDGSTRTKLAEIETIYQELLDKYLGKNTK